MADFTKDRYFKLSSDLHVNPEEYRPDFSINKSRSIVKTLPPSIGAYGDVYEYDQYAPDENLSFDGEGLDETDAETLRQLCLSRYGEVTLEDDSVNTEYTGIIESISTSRIAGSARNTFRISMKKTS